MEKRKIAAFDFDGTITTKDTFLRFIKFSKGSLAFYWGLFLYSPVILAYKLKLYPNWKAKQLVFTHFFKGMEHSRFVRLGERFADEVEIMKRPLAIKEISLHQGQGTKVYIITASIYEWVFPWCMKNGIESLLATNIEVDSAGLITGKFLSPNCYGREKVIRLLEKEPDRNSYTLFAYGDSRGDRELIKFADKGWFKKFN